MKQKKISVIGSTGSIGKSTLAIVRNFPKKYKVVSLVCKSNITLLEKQIREFKPKYVGVNDQASAMQLRQKIKDLNVRVFGGAEGVEGLCKKKHADLVVFAVIGACGLGPLIETIKTGTDVAIANKEPLAIAGPLIMSLSKKHGAKLLPIDSELSGLFQCLHNQSVENVKALILTASGGPFWKTKSVSFSKLTPTQALKHPKWKMGKKITIDSATMMNKGLEVIEASNFFCVPIQNVRILIHPQAVVHSIVEYKDGSHIAQISETDMKLPIMYCMSYPERLQNGFHRFSLSDIGQIEFYEPDFKKFPALKLAYYAGQIGGTMPAALNAANEIAVDMFLRKKIKFTEIYECVEKVTRKHRSKQATLNHILDADRWAREEAQTLC